LNIQYPVLNIQYPIINFKVLIIDDLNGGGMFFKKKLNMLQKGI